MRWTHGSDSTRRRSNLTPRPTNAPRARIVGLLLLSIGFRAAFAAVTVDGPVHHAEGDVEWNVGWDGASVEVCDGVGGFCVCVLARWVV